MFPGKPAFTTTLSNGTSIAQGLFIEAFTTGELVFTVLMLAAEKTKATFIAPGRRPSRRSFRSMALDTTNHDKEELLILNMLIVGIGLALFVAELAGMLSAGAEPNPWTIVDVYSRCLFYRWLSESCPVIWSVCRHCELPRLPLDILAWAITWCLHLRRILSIRQVQ